jgi:hypothetical protein
MLDQKQFPKEFIRSPGGYERVILDRDRITRRRSLRLALFVSGRIESRTQRFACGFRGISSLPASALQQARPSCLFISFVAARKAHRFGRWSVARSL